MTVFQKNITLISVYEKITSQSLETPSHALTIFSKKNIKGKLYTYAFGLCEQKHSFFRIFKLIIGDNVVTSSIRIAQVFPELVGKRTHAVWKVYGGMLKYIIN